MTQTHSPRRLEKLALSNPVIVAFKKNLFLSSVFFLASHVRVFPYAKSWDNINMAVALGYLTVIASITASNAFYTVEQSSLEIVGAPPEQSALLITTAIVTAALGAFCMLLCQPDAMTNFVTS